MVIRSITLGDSPSHLKLSFYEQLEGNELELKVCMIYNAICLLSAASNLRTVSFDYNECYTELEREQLEEWFGLTINDELTEYRINNQIERRMKELSSLPI